MIDESDDAAPGASYSDGKDSVSTDSSPSPVPTHPSSLIAQDPSVVSVVVPSYNHAAFVERTLRSIFKQAPAPLELVVIDDGSIDGSPRVIESALKDCPFACELVARENRGLCATLNEGLARTRGSLFAYLGSDDFWLPGFLAARTELLETRPRAALAYGNAYSVDADDRIIDCTTDWALYRDGDVRRMLLEILAPLSPTVVYRRDALELYGWNESARLEDYELYLRLSAEGEFAFDPRVLSAWRQHGSNESEDLRMMMRERLAAQRRTAPALGLAAGELERFQTLAKFRSAEEFARRGHKLQAVRLALANFSGAASPVEVVKMLARLAVPHALLRRRRESARQEAMRHYGKLEV